MASRNKIRHVASDAATFAGVRKKKYIYITHANVEDFCAPDLVHLDRNAQFNDLNVFHDRLEVEFDLGRSERQIESIINMADKSIVDSDATLQRTLQSSSYIIRLAMRSKPLATSSDLQRLQSTASTGKNVLELPQDVWLLILDEFHNAPIIKTEECSVLPPDLRERHLANFKDLLALRSTCRTLRSYVDPRLLPTLHVELNSKSLERLEVLSKNKDIASGVRCLDVHLGLLPASAAYSMEDFLGRVRDVLSDIEDALRRGTPFPDERARTSSRKFEQISEAVRQLWLSDYSSSSATQWSGYDREPAVRRYLQLLRDCFKPYAERAWDQERLGRDGSFGWRVALVVSRLKNLTHVNVDDSGLSERHAEHLLNSRQAAIKLLSNFRCLQRHMIDTVTWSKIEDIDNTRERLGRQVPARVLTDLPFACHLLGAPLRGLSVACFPLYKDHLIEYASRPGFDSHSMENLARASQSLRTFHFLPYPLKWGYESSETIRSPEVLQRFVAAASSGPEMESLGLAIRYSCPGPSPDWFDVNLLCRNWSERITNLSFLGVAFTDTDLEMLVASLPTSLKELKLAEIELTKGTYAKVVGMLREKSLSKVQLYCLSGGEFTPAASPWDNFDFDDAGGAIDADMEALLVRDAKERAEKKALLQRVRVFICKKEDMVNPLLEYSPSLAK